MAAAGNTAARQAAPKDLQVVPTTGSLCLFIRFNALAGRPFYTAPATVTNMS